jgi:hypothetical protein
MNDYTWKRINEGFLRWPQARAAPVEEIEFDQAMSKFGLAIDPEALAATNAALDAVERSVDHIRTVIVPGGTN